MPKLPENTTGYRPAPWLSEAIKAAVPTNVRAFGRGIAGDRSPINESFFRDEELAALRRAARRAFAEQPESDLTYRHYEQKSTGHFEPFLQDPNLVALTTIGKAKLVREPAGDVHLLDNYDFDRIFRNRDDMKKGLSFLRDPLYFGMALLGQELIPPGKGFPIRLNLGNPDQWGEQGELRPVPKQQNETEKRVRDALLMAPPPSIENPP